MTKKIFLLAAVFLAVLLEGATIDMRVTADTQDAEERVSDGQMDNNDRTLDLGYENANQQIVGMRFQNLALPADAHIRNAYLQFRARGNDSDPANFVIVGEASADAAAITLTDYDLSGRAETTQTYTWSVPAWSWGTNYQSGDLSAIVQEVKDISGWTSGNDMLFMVKAGAGCTDGTCRRRASSFDDRSTRAPLLHIEYGTPPVLGTIPDQEGAVGRFFDLNISDYVTATDGDAITSYTLSGTLPSGLNFDTATGRLSGTPAAIETQPLSVYATDQDGDSNSVAFSVTIAVPQPPVMGVVPDQVAAVGGSFDLDLSTYVTQTDGDPILSYTLSGTLPAGLSFNTATGVISGTPSGEETQNLSVYATDVDGDSNSAAFSIETIDTNGLQVEFRMDECYWLGGANGVTDDVKDSSGFGLDAQSRNLADNTATNFKICRAGNFDNTYVDPTLSDAVFYPNETAAELNIGDNAPFSISTWLYRNSGSDKWMAAVIKVSDENWADGWGLEHENGAGDTITFFVGAWNLNIQGAMPADTWTHVVGTYDGSQARLYVNGAEVAGSPQTLAYTAGAHAVVIGDDTSGVSIDDRWQGNIDEVKIWSRALSGAEVSTIYTNENGGLNYDGSARVCLSCTGADIAAHSWELVGIPVDDRTPATAVTVDDIFGDDMPGVLNTDWVVYRRDYSETSNASSYTALSLTDTLEFGQGYWLGSRLAARWDIDGATAVDYNSSSNGTMACVSSTGNCVDIVLKAVTKNFGAPDFDANDGSGPYRNNMGGFIGIQNPVNWADCRLIFDDNGTVYTPSDANASGLANKQIWLYDPSDGSANSNGYITCADDSPGGCKLVPFNGFWVQLTGKTKGHSVKLVVPEK